MLDAEMNKIITSLWEQKKNDKSRRTNGGDRGGEDREWEWGGKREKMEEEGVEI